ncbi:MAG: MBL fold metallo-hydrolase [Candidatus Eisenbacteria bacterium]
MIQVGNYEIASVAGGYDRLDGGAMFGVVPKILWEKTQDVDGQNRMRMALRVLVAVDRSAGRLILVDAAAGSRWERDEAERFAIEDDSAAVAGALAAFGFGADDVTDLILTHLHFDHCGGATLAAPGSSEETGPRFPNATIWAHAAQWKHASSPSVKDRASYRAGDLRGIEHSGKLRLLDGHPPASPFPGVRWIVSNGHTPGQLLPLFEDDRRPLLFASDMIPTAAHLPLPWVMAYDLHPMTTIEEKERVLALCRERDLRIAFCHDRRAGAVSVAFEKGKPRVGEVLDLDPPRVSIET